MLGIEVEDRYLVGGLCYRLWIVLVEVRVDWISREVVNGWRVLESASQHWK